MKEIKNTKRTKPKKCPKNKYQMGSFVTSARDLGSQYNQQISQLNKPQGGNIGSSAMSMAGTGASIGGGIAPGIGHIIGGLGGMLLGGIFGSSAKRREERAYRDQVNKLNTAKRNQIQDLYNYNIDVNNENPYGVYQDGGRVKKGNLAINTGKKKIINKKGVTEYNSGYDPKYPEGNPGFNIMHNAIEFLDPTGISSWGDIGDAWKSDSSLGSKLLETSSGLPFIRNLKKLGVMGKGIYGATNHSDISDTIDDIKKYDNGGDINTQLTKINIEKGELQVDPETGKILREYKGINPETGGMYERHAKGNKKDTHNNMVTAEEGTFIITNKEAKNYKKAVDNNDKFYQNAIMSNIRNQKKSMTNKYQTGGDILNPIPNIYSAGVNLSPIAQPEIRNNLMTVPRSNMNFSNSDRLMNAFDNINWGNVTNTAINYLPSLYNMFQGSRRANTMPYTPIRMNVDNRRRILSEMPREISANPALNNIRRDRNRALRGINRSTNSPAISRANRLALESNYIGAENEALYQNQMMNNQIRGQRAQILSGLGFQDQQRESMNVQNLNNTFLQNRQMQLAKEQQFNYGLSQAHQMYQNNRTNRQRRNMEDIQMETLKTIFPVLAYYQGLTNKAGGN